MHTSRLASLLILTAPAFAQGTLSAQLGCAAAVQDMSSPSDCIGASSVPTPGALLPLGPYFFVAPNGDVGLGTQAPAGRLDVVGDTLISGLLAVGDAAEIGGDPNWTTSADISYTVDQFSPFYTLGLFSRIQYEPTVDLTGNQENWLWSHVFEARIPTGNDRDVRALYGPTASVLPRGSGTVDIVLGTGAVAENDAGHSIDQAGGAFTSGADHDATIDLNSWIYAVGGHWGPNGSVQTDIGLFIDQPWVESPLQNHYGIYLADQDFGVNDSYAIYAEGGANYLAGDLGVGTATPAAKLDVNGDFVASGTKSFRQDHPYDPTREIWFVCLEGNEAGTYFRGTAQLANGRVEIPVPDEFALVSCADGLTVQVTALGDARVWVEEKSLERIVVRGSADIAFDYFVNGVRAGHQDFQSMRAKPAARATGIQDKRERFPLRAEDVGPVDKR